MLPISSPKTTVGTNNRRDEEDASSVGKKHATLVSFFRSLLCRIGVVDYRKIIHSIKVGIALVLVSLLSILQPLNDPVGDNAMWAVMTVVVVFEFTAGATISKGINRAVGTMVGGGLGCAIALVAKNHGEIGRALTICPTVFLFSAIASFYRLVPSIKRKFDYGFMIFILTFNLVAVSGFRGEEIIKLAINRLSTIGVGIIICEFTSLFIFPIWAGDELHRCLVSKFDNLALSIKDCFEEYFKPMDRKGETQTSIAMNGCKLVLNSKSSDETLANFASWEPWHGKFRFCYPWNKYLLIGELLRELAACIIALEGSLRSDRQSPASSRLTIKEPCEAVGKLLCFTLRELGDTIFKMKQLQLHESITGELHLTRLQLQFALSACKFETSANENDIGGRLPLASILLMLKEIVDKVEILAKEVEQLGGLAGFLAQ
ncbi:hypothetical protein MRB53_029462 [Persea americana]|uniref:Uncharacterized protein n=1 Tax=Persea americana TaxID=3435 RepID=A0ACC2KIM4_PERAE|nr:hypothetical protein MRB53_029462 [Persea americana]